MVRVINDPEGKCLKTVIFRYSFLFSCDILFIGVDNKEILSNFINLLKLKNHGHNVFFTNIDKIKKQMLEELENLNK